MNEIGNQLFSFDISNDEEIKDMYVNYYMLNKSKRSKNNLKRTFFDSSLTGK